MNKCARCDIETDNDFGENSNLWIENLKIGAVRHARYLCDPCTDYVVNKLKKFTLATGRDKIE
jgi:hypothetical protein